MEKESSLARTRATEFDQVDSIKSTASPMLDGAPSSTTPMVPFLLICGPVIADAPGLFVVPRPRLTTWPNYRGLPRYAKTSSMDNIVQSSCYVLAIVFRPLPSTSTATVEMRRTNVDIVMLI